MTPQNKPPPANANTNTNTTAAPRTIARFVSPRQLKECGERLRLGDLVSFPTETVYGLGCNALDSNAIQKVFKAKERPLTDPLIVHVANPQDALDLWQAGNDDGDGVATTTTKSILELLCNEFWPGPLTLVAKANTTKVPSILMANTGYVACRMPSHELAQELIQEAKVPIAAPSANKFGHVSPTQAQHVMDDLGQEDVWILQQRQQQQQQDDINDNNNDDDDASAVVCQVGVESTVAKLEEIDAKTTHKLTVLRQGAISVQDLQGCLSRAGQTSSVLVSSLTNRTVKETQATVAPGQTIKHYSPRIPSFLLAPSLLLQLQQQSSSLSLLPLLHKLLQQSIVLDFGGRLAKAAMPMAATSTPATTSGASTTTVSTKTQLGRQYRDLSTTGNSAEAAQCVFEALRWAETIDNEAKFIVFPQLVATNTTTNTNHDHEQQEEDALLLALHDRLTRAASGVVLDSLESIKQHIPSSLEAAL